MLQNNIETQDAQDIAELNATEVKLASGGDMIDDFTYIMTQLSYYLPRPAPTTTTIRTPTATLGIRD